MVRRVFITFQALTAFAAIQVGACSCNDGGFQPDAGGDCTPGSLNCICVSGNRCQGSLICNGGICLPGGTGPDGAVLPPGDGSVIGPGAPDVGPNPDAFVAGDPPPEMCLMDGSRVPVPPPMSSNPDCPDDKNLEGCRCDATAEPQPCWPGLRKEPWSRNLSGRHDDL